MYKKYIYIVSQFIIARSFSNELLCFLVWNLDACSFLLCIEDLRIKLKSDVFLPTLADAYELSKFFFFFLIVVFLLIQSLKLISM
jgi:hypothetical protein